MEQTLLPIHLLSGTYLVSRKIYFWFLRGETYLISFKHLTYFFEIILFFFNFPSAIIKSASGSLQVTLSMPSFCLPSPMMNLSQVTVRQSVDAKWAVRSCAKKSMDHVMQMPNVEYEMVKEDVTVILVTMATDLNALVSKTKQAVPAESLSFLSSSFFFLNFNHVGNVINT